MRKKISDKLRWKKYKEYNYKCICCDESDLSKLEIDHIVPLARGGNDDDNNLQVLCSKCNGNKGQYQCGEYYYKERSDNPDLLYNVIAKAPAARIPTRRAICLNSGEAITPLAPCHASPNVNFSLRA